MDVSRRRKTSGPGTKDFITHSKSENQSFMFLRVSFLYPPNPEEVMQGPIMQWVVWQEKNTEIYYFYSKWKQACFFPGGDITSSFKVAHKGAKTALRSGQGKEQSRDCILGTLSKNVQTHLGSTVHCLCQYSLLSLTHSWPNLNFYTSVLLWQPTTSINLTNRSQNQIHSICLIWHLIKSIIKTQSSRWSQPAVLISVFLSRVPDSSLWINLREYQSDFRQPWGILGPGYFIH